MRKVKRSSAIVISMSDDEKDKHFVLKTNFGYSKSVPAKRIRKRANRAPLSDSRSDVLKDYNANDFDVVKQFCEEFDHGFPHCKGSGRNLDLWVDKHKPTSLEDLAVQKKKVNEVKMWFEERLKTSGKNSHSNVLLVSGEAGVGKSATVYVVAYNLGAQVHEWSTPTPTIWHEHKHLDNMNLGLRYVSKMDEFESFVERIRKYGLSSMIRASTTPIILLIDDLPVVNGKNACGRLHRCLHLLLQSVNLPTAILIDDYGKSDSAEYNTRYWEELQQSKAGACKVNFNPITLNSLKRALSKICRQEQFQVGDEQIDLIAKASGGDIRSAITSLQYFCLKPISRHSLSFPSGTLANSEEEMDRINQVDSGMYLPFGRDATLSLFHALGKFLHNKRESESLSAPDRNAILLKEKFVRLPLKMDAPEMVLSQAHGQTRTVADFLHENVLDFINDDAIEDAWFVSSYLSDADFLLGTLGGTRSTNFEAENIVQSAAASIAVRGVLFGNARAVTSRWHAIRKPMVWQVYQSLRQNKYQMVSRWNDMHSRGTNLCKFSDIATEFNPALNRLGYRATKYSEIQQVYTGEDEFLDNDSCGDEIEDW